MQHILKTTIHCHNNGDEGIKIKLQREEEKEER